MRKTTIWLGRDELNALWRLVHTTGRSRSELIRDGIRRVARSIPATTPAPSATPAPIDPTQWYSREEERLFPLINMRYSIEQMAREEHVGEAVIRERLASIERRKQAWRERSAARYRGEPR